MGIFECDRNGCNNVMCGRFSWQLQYYICHECFGELVDYVNARGGIPSEDMIREFMQSEKPTFLFEKQDAYDALNKLFEVR